MAINIQLNPGVSGDITRAEELAGGVKIPVVKLHLGAVDVDDGPVGETSRLPVSMGQVTDSGNTNTLDAGEATPWTGTWFQTRTKGIIRNFTVLASNVSSGLGGTFTFQFSDDGVNPTISEAKTIVNFATVRDFDLKNAGEYYRVIFTPSRALVGGEQVYITTVHSRQFEGFFVRPLDQPLERQNLVLPHQAVFLKGFNTINNFAEDVTISAMDGRRALDVTIRPQGSLFTRRGRVTTSATTTVAVRKTGFTEQTVGAQRSVNSTSALDTAAGTGARTVRLTYYTNTVGVVAGPFTETMTLAGVTPVSTVATDICHVERIDVLTAGSTGSNAGIIQLHAETLGLGGVIASIAATDLITLYAHHYLPSGKKWFLTRMQASSGASSGVVVEFLCRSFSLSITNSAEFPFLEIDVQGSSGTREVTISAHDTIQGPARILWYVTPGSGMSQLQKLSFDGYETD